MTTALEHMKPDDALASGHTLTCIDGAEADALVTGAPGPAVDGREPLIVTGDLNATMREAWSIVNRWNGTEPRLFKTPDGRGLVGIHETQSGPVTMPYHLDNFRGLLVEIIRFMRPAKGTGQTFDVNPDDKLIRTMLANPSPELPTLSHIVTAPVLGPDFRLTLSPGYHEAGRIYYQQSHDFNLPTIPDKPTPVDVAAAVEQIRQTFSDFPFAESASIANLIAALVTPFVRDAIDGPTPLFLVSKAQRGTGGTLLCDAISTIVAGQAVSMIPPMKDDNELRKTLGAVLGEGRPVVSFDNLEDLKGGTLAAALTGRTWSGRLLGQNVTQNVEPRCLWLANGNNPRISSELARRIVYVRMVAQVEDPSARAGFQIPDLIAWCKKHRPELVTSILILIRAWIVAGRPDGTSRMASFDSWARIVGGILGVAGIDGFLENRQDLDNDANDEDTAIRELIAAWWDAYATEPVGTSELVDFAEGRIDLGAGDEHGRQIQFGRVVASLVGRIYDGLRVESAGKKQNRRMYRLTETSKNQNACRE